MAGGLGLGMRARVISWNQVWQNRERNKQSVSQSRSKCLVQWRNHGLSQRNMSHTERQRQSRRSGVSDESQKRYRVG